MRSILSETTSTAFALTSPNISRQHPSDVLPPSITGFVCRAPACYTAMPEIKQHCLKLALFSVLFVRRAGRFCVAPTGQAAGAYPRQPTTRTTTTTTTTIRHGTGRACRSSPTGQSLDRVPMLAPSAIPLGPFAVVSRAPPSPSAICTPTRHRVAAGGQRSLSATEVGPCSPCALPLFLFGLAGAASHFITLSPILEGRPPRLSLRSRVERGSVCCVFACWVADLRGMQR